MNGSLTITTPVNFGCAAKGQRRLQPGKPLPVPVLLPGSVPRVARLMALATRFDGQVRTGVLASYSALAELGHVTRARVSQIMNLVNLAPDIQEAILFLPRTEQGRDPIRLALLQPITAVIDWKKQRRFWSELRQKT